MGVHNPIARTSRSLLGFCVTLLVIVSSCYCDNVLKTSSTVQVVGVATCSDCAQSNLLSTHALSGLRVTIDCKVSEREFKTRGVSKLDKDGKFKVTLPSEIVKDDGELKEECFAQLHSASNAPCPTHKGLEASKLILKSKDQQTGKHTFSPNGQISISPITCQSAFFWPPMPKFPPHPWFKKTHPWFKKPIPKFKLPNFPPLPPKVFPPIYKHPWFKKPIPPPTPVYVPTPKVEVPPTPVYVSPPKVELPPTPVYVSPPKVELPPTPVHVPTPKVEPPPTPVYVPTPKVNPPPVHKKKPCPPPVPVHVPTPKVNPPPTPVYVPTPKANPPPVHKKKKPCPPPVPVHVPTPKVNPPPTPVYVPTPKVNPPPVPVYKEPIPPPTPIYKPHPPIYKKPLPPIPKIPPFFKKPCPPLPPLPPFPKIPPKLLHPFPKIHKKFFHHPIPKIPKKFFKHPKFGKWPPMPPFTSHP